MFLICLGFPFGGKIAGPGEARSALNFAPLPQFSASACDWPSGLLSPTQIASKDLILLHFFTNRYALHRTVAICPLPGQAPEAPRRLVTAHDLICPSLPIYPMGRQWKKHSDPWRGKPVAGSVGPWTAREPGGEN